MIIGNSPFNCLYLPKRLRNAESEKYYQKSDLKVFPNTTFHIVSEHLSRVSTVLDVGCSSGYFGKFLIDTLGIKVYGVDIDENGLSVAKEAGYSDVFKLDLDSDIEVFESILNEVNPDYVLCLDVIEHLKNANLLMNKLLKFLNKGNSEIIISVPNIGHLDVVYNLLMGRFNYSLLGILDNTHLRFFTKSSFEEWLNLMVEDMDMKLDIDLIGRTEAKLCFNKNEKTFNKDILKLYRMAKRVGNDDLFTVQFVFSLRKRIE